MLHFLKIFFTETYNPSCNAMCYLTSLVTVLVNIILVSAIHSCFTAESWTDD